MSAARGFIRLASRYEKKMQINHEEMVRNRDFHITQLREAIEAADKLLDICYSEFESWCDSMQALYEVDEFDNFFERIELVVLKWYVNWMYCKSVKEIQDTENAKKRLKRVQTTLEVLNAFR